MGTAARASILAAFTSAQGYSADADYSPKAWLINRTRITKGAAVALHRVGPAGRRASAGRGRAGGRGTVRVGRPDDLRLDGQAARRTAGKPPTRSWSPRPGPGWTCGTWPGWPGRSTPGRCPRTPTATRMRRSRTGRSRWRRTFDGAGVLTGDLTPECAAVVTAVLDALSAPAGAEDDRSQAQRYHDALQRGDAAAGHRRAAARAGRAAGQGLGAHLAGRPDACWTAARRCWRSGPARVRARWAGHRAAASAGGGDGGAWLDGDAARRVACDAAMAPVVTGDVNPAALEDLVRLCVELDRLRHHRGTGQRRPTGGQGAPAPGHHPGLGSPRAGHHRQGRRPAVRPRRPGVVPAPPAARRPAGRAEPAAGHRLQRDHPGRDPQRGHPARPALPVGRAVQPARGGVPGPPRQAQGQRRQDQRPGLCSTVLVPPPGGDPPVGLDPGPEPRRHHHRLEPGQDQGPAQPQPTRPGRVRPGHAPRGSAQSRWWYRRWSRGGWRCSQRPCGRDRGDADGTPEARRSSCPRVPSSSGD